MATPYFRITLLRSAIGLPLKTRGVLGALGLTKRMKTVYIPVSPTCAGHIMRVKELVDVEEVDRPKTIQEMRAERRPERGYWVERRAEEGASSRLESGDGDGAA